VAYDICAVNTVLNFYANQLGQEYDDRGAIARSGSVHVPLLTELNDLEYYNLPYPKSLGFEFVKTVILPMIESYDIRVQDKLATFTGHVAVQLAGAINKEGKNKSVLITGGGAYNDYLIELLMLKLKDNTIIIPDDKTVQYKEALIFGLLGVLRYRGEINVLSDVTGAPHDHCAGYIYAPI
jgi:anhydro-N-acetylmuramic acid kinase